MIKQILRYLLLSSLMIYLLANTTHAYSILGESIEKNGVKAEQEKLQPSYPQETGKLKQETTSYPQENEGLRQRKVQIYFNYSPFNVSEARGGTQISLAYDAVVGYGLEGNYFIPNSKVGYGIGICYNQVTGLKSKFSAGQVGISSIYGNLLYKLYEKENRGVNLGAGLNGAIWNSKDPIITTEIGYQGHIDLISYPLSIRLGYEHLAGSAADTFGPFTINADGFFLRFSTIFDLF